MAIDVLTEEVAANLEEAAEVTRKISSKGVGFFFGGFVVGVAAGFYFGYRYNREKIKAEAFKESEEEIAKMREFYKQKKIAASEKPDLDILVEGYGGSQIQQQEVTKNPPGQPSKRLTRPPVPVQEPSVPVEIPTSELVVDGLWDYAEELENRTPEFPYVIHQEEFMDSETGYVKVSYTYYAEDDVLTDEDDIPLPHADIIVGQTNLKFGHGTDDPDVVFVRNEHMELEMEISRSPKSYEKEVLGINDDHDDDNVS